MLDSLLQKSKGILNDILNRKPEVSLVALIKLANSISWDFVVGGNHLSPSAENIQWVSNILTNKLDSNELGVISRIVLLPADNGFVKGMNSTIEVNKEDASMNVVDLQISGTIIKEGHVIYCMARV